MALPQFDTIAATPLFESKSVLGLHAPLPPAAPRNPRHVMPTARHDDCVNNVPNASLTSLRKDKGCPVLILGVQHCYQSAPAMLAFRTAFERMKEKGIQNMNLGVKNNDDKEGNIPESASRSRAMDKLNALSSTSPGSLMSDRRRRRKVGSSEGSSNKNATFDGQRNAQQILAGLLAKTNASGAGFTKTSSSGKLVLGHAMGMSRTPSGARLLNNSSRKVRSSGNLLF
jgi:hypothetical protein